MDDVCGVWCGGSAGWLSGFGAGFMTALRPLLAVIINIKVSRPWPG